MKKVLIKVDGMTCAGCASGLEKTLNSKEGIIKADVNLVMCNASIEYDERVINLDNINSFIKEAGFKSLGEDKFDIEKKSFKKESVNLIITIALGVILMYISMGHMVNLKIPFFDINNNPKWHATILMVLSTLIISLSYKVIVNGIKRLIHKTPNMDTLISVGVITSYIYSMYFFVLTLAVNTMNVHKLYFGFTVQSAKKP